MKGYLVLALALVVIASAAYLLYRTEQTVSLSDFRNELNNTRKIAVVMDTRYSEFTGPVMQCGVEIAGTLGAIGKYDALKNRTFVYEGEQCFYENATASIKECESLISGSTFFYIRYNSEKNSTSFYKSKAVVEGDTDFLLDCAISRMIGG